MFQLIDPLIFFRCEEKTLQWIAIESEKIKAAAYVKISINCLSLINTEIKSLQLLLLNRRQKMGDESLYKTTKETKNFMFFKKWNKL